ncbi:CBS domain-containing protein [Flavobacterium terrigena]|uniref:CBS domain-containing protein n=1 Tax=Flavobacterium terrigena TaxID=402734 RepID=A0A1H6X9Q7_9FLAO|nr:CBS domain-containing protein [Flavobacterium terrigena]SEJ24846.1 CBS domain-containing protein [Flavobacterium terrigena]
MDKITDFLNNQFQPLQVSDSFADVENLFLDYDYSHFPVLENGIYIGSIAKEEAEILPTTNLINEHKLSLHRFFVRSNMNWFDIFEEFSKNHTNLLPVLDDKNQYIGFYELDDVLHFLNETTFVKEDGGIIVIEKETTDFTFSQICQIVESNDSKILGVFISNSTPTLTQITLKISQNNFNEIIQTFRRYNYTILSEHQEDSYLAGLKDRSDYLDKYLNI